MSVDEALARLPFALGYSPAIGTALITLRAALTGDAYDEQAMVQLARLLFTLGETEREPLAKEAFYFLSELATERAHAKLSEDLDT